MASPDVLDFERLLRPISDDQPAGGALRSDPATSAAFYAVREACQRARELERRAGDFKLLSDDEKENEANPSAPNWQDVVSSAADLLAEKSKDLWVAAWLIEGLTRTQGFAGLRDGFRLIRQLSDSFWGSIHPRPDEDEGIAHTVSQLSSLNDTLNNPILDITLVPASDSLRAFSSSDYIDAVAVDRTTNPQERARKIERGCPTMEALSRAVGKVPAAELANIKEDIDQTISEFKQLSKALDDKCGADAPLGSRIETTLIDCQDRMRDLTRDVLGVAKGQNEEERTTDDSAAPTGSGKGAVPSGEVRNRTEAFQYLLKISDFFRRTEPHSPVSYALEQAVRWGKMSLPELMSDLIADDLVRREMFRRAGIPEAQTSESNKE